MSDDVDVLDLWSKKTEILRAIETEVGGGGMVAETILERLEMAEELDKALGNAESASLSSAYSMVALECTVRFMVAGDGNSAAGLKYLRAFDRIWRRRFQRLEGCGGESELSGEVEKWWLSDVELSGYDRGVCSKLFGLSTRNEALRLVRVYLDEERARSSNSEIREEDNDSGVAEIHDQDTASVKINDDKNSWVEDKEVKAKRSLRRLQASPTQPSPSVLLGAEIMMSLSNVNTSRDHILKDQTEQEVNEEAYYQDVQHIVDQIVQTCNANLEKPTRPELRERKSTVTTYEWDDLIDGSPEAKTNRRRRRTRANGPKGKVNASSSKENESPKVSKRRMPRRWSLREEDTLRDAVRRFGNAWKFILTTYHDEFGERTDVDLKDKWRNMRKYSQC